MRASVSMAREGFARLKRQIAAIEGRPHDFAPAEDGPSGTEARDIPAAPPPVRLSPCRGGERLRLGIADLDRRLGGGLRHGALHEFRGDLARDAAAVTGFATALLARLSKADGRPLLWVTEAATAHETGAPYGPGLDHFGLDSRRLIMVVVRRPEDVLWVFEEGLRCTGLAAVLAEMSGHPRRLDLTASRRLALRAGQHGVMGLLLRQSAAAEPGAAATRWHVSPLPASSLDDFDRGIGRPAWRLALERNRAGMTGSFDLEWDHERQSFARAVPAALSLPRASLSSDRPDPARMVGEVVALRRAS